jgi:hypothetical protein
LALFILGCTGDTPTLPPPKIRGAVIRIPIYSGGIVMFKSMDDSSFVIESISVNNQYVFKTDDGRDTLLADKLAMGETRGYLLKNFVRNEGDSSVTPQTESVIKITAKTDHGAVDLHVGDIVDYGYEYRAVFRTAQDTLQ